MKNNTINFDGTTIRVVENEQLERGKILFVSGSNPRKFQVLTGLFVECVDKNGEIVDQYAFHEAIQEWNRKHR